MLTVDCNAWYDAEAHLPQAYKAPDDHLMAIGFARMSVIPYDEVAHRAFSASMARGRLAPSRNQHPAMGADYEGKPKPWAARR